MPPNQSLLHPAMEYDDYEDLRMFACKRVGASEAADLVQETYLRFLEHENMGSVREPRPFLFKIAANLGIDHWRKARVRGEWAAHDEPVDFDAIASAHPGPEARVHSRMQLESLLAALDELPELQRHAFVLNKYEGWTHAAIAERLGVAEKTVRRHIAGVIAHCAQRLGYHDEE